MSTKITKDGLYNLMKTFFIDDYVIVENSIKNINTSLEHYEIDGYDYKDYCSTCLTKIKFLIDNSSNVEFINFNLSKIAIIILNNMIIDKLKTKNSPEIEEQILYLNNKINEL